MPSLPVTDLLLLLGVAGLVYFAARSRPAPMQNGNAVKVLVDQVAAITADRDKWKDLALRYEIRIQEQERDLQGYRLEIRRRNEDDERRRQELR